MQVLFEKTVDLLTKAQLFSKENRLSDTSIINYYKTLDQLHARFPLFNKSELDDITRESFETRGNRNIIDPRDKFGSILGKRTAEPDSDVAGILKTVTTELPVSDRFREP